MSIESMSAEEFRAALASMGLSQTEAAARLGVPWGQPRVSQWCTGLRHVPPYIAAHVRTLLELERVA